jgi:hypothetical protein
VDFGEPRFTAQLPQPLAVLPLIAPKSSRQVIGEQSLDVSVKA